MYINNLKFNKLFSNYPWINVLEIQVAIIGKILIYSIQPCIIDIDVWILRKIDWIQNFIKWPSHLSIKTPNLMILIFLRRVQAVAYRELLVGWGARLFLSKDSRDLGCAGMELGGPGANPPDVGEVLKV